MKLRAIVVTTALAIGGVGTAAPVQAVRADDIPPAVLLPSGGADCKNSRFTDCGLLTLQAIVSKDLNPAGSTVLLQLSGCEGDTDVKMFIDDAALPVPRVGTPYDLDTAPVSEDGSAYEVPFMLWTKYPGESFNLGPDWSGSFTVNRPGLAPWTYAFDHDTALGEISFGRYTDGLVCPRDDKDSSALVDSWSRTKGKPIVGRKVRASPTVLDPVGMRVGATVSYAWVVDGKVVRRSLNARVKRAYVGKMLGFRFTVSAPGKKSSGATIYLGRVRLRT